MKNGLEMMEQKLKSKFFKKKPEDLEEAIEEKETESIKSPDGLDCLRELAKDGPNNSTRSASN